MLNDYLRKRFMLFSVHVYSIQKPVNFRRLNFIMHSGDLDIRFPNSFIFKIRYIWFTLCQWCDDVIKFIYTSLENCWNCWNRWYGPPLYVLTVKLRVDFCFCVDDAKNFIWLIRFPMIIAIYLFKMKDIRNDECVKLRESI